MESLKSIDINLIEFNDSFFDRTIIEVMDIIYFKDIAYRIKKIKKNKFGIEIYCYDPYETSETEILTFFIANEYIKFFEYADNKIKG